MPGKRNISCRGFTLIEMAMVMVVMGLIMLTVFPALSAMRTSSQRALTQNNLNLLMQATAAYVQANGCLPCPTPATTTGPGFGHVRGDSAANPSPCTATGKTCAAEGIPPFLSLGIPASAAHDGYNHWISMRVDPLLTTAFGIVPPTAPCSCTQNGSTCTASSSACTCALVSSVCVATPANQSVQGMCQKNLSTASGASPVQVITPGGSSATAAVIFVSYGAQGFGSFMASAQQMTTRGVRISFPSASTPCAGTCFGGFAQCNASAKGFFCDAPYTVDDTGVFAYDDQLAFADRNTLVSRFGNGSCQAVW
jgi:prepilin-type N-terminal cleavage/methylation domain-containing protein